MHSQEAFYKLQESCHLNCFLQWTLWGHDLSYQHLPRTPDGCEESVSPHPASLAKLPEEYWSLKNHRGWQPAKKTSLDDKRENMMFHMFPTNRKESGLQIIHPEFPQQVPASAASACSNFMQFPQFKRYTKLNCRTWRLLLAPFFTIYAFGAADSKKSKNPRGALALCWKLLSVPECHPCHIKRSCE